MVKYELFIRHLVQLAVVLIEAFQKYLQVCLEAGMPFQSNTTSSSFGLAEKRNGYKVFRKEKKKNPTKPHTNKPTKTDKKHCTRYLAFKVLHVTFLRFHHNFEFGLLIGFSCWKKCNYGVNYFHSKRTKEKGGVAIYYG